MYFFKLVENFEQGGRKEQEDNKELVGEELPLLFGCNKCSDHFLVVFVESRKFFHEGFSKGKVSRRCRP